MRISAMIAAFIFSASTFAACPNLTGKYAACISTSGATEVTDLVVNQSIQNKVTVYNVSSTDEDGERASEVYKADGKTVRQDVTDEDSGITLTTLTTVSCPSNNLSIRTKFVMFGESVGYTNMSVYKKGSDLIIETETNDGEETVKDKEVCR